MPCASLSQSSASFSHASLSTQIAVSAAFRRHAAASRRYLSAEISGIVKPTPALGCRQQLCSQIGYEVPIVLRTMVKSFECSAFPPAPSPSLPARIGNSMMACACSAELCRPFADPEVAARKIIEIANSVEAAQDGRIHIPSAPLGSRRCPPRSARWI